MLKPQSKYVCIEKVLGVTFIEGAELKFAKQIFVNGDIFFLVI